MITRTCLSALAVAALVAGCGKILGLQDPNLDLPAPGLDASQNIDAAPTDGAAAIDGAPIDGPPIDGPPGCDLVACPFGCETGTTVCRTGKLWVFPTTGSFVGNGFGGTANPPVVRATADARCLETYTTTHSARQCNRNRMHAVLFVGPADSLALMATQYTIPTTVPVHRADDDVLVSNNWNDLIDTTRAPRAPVTSAPTLDEGIIWSGANGSSTCTGWTLPSGSGARGHTTLTASNWLVRDTGACDTLARLLCVCWSGGE